LGEIKPIPCLDPQTPQQEILTNKLAGILGFVEANLLETHFRVWVYLFQIPSILVYLYSLSPYGFAASFGK
jgi:hypothetical protein